MTDYTHIAGVSAYGIYERYIHMLEKGDPKVNLPALKEAFKIELGRWIAGNEWQVGQWLLDFTNTYNYYVAQRASREFFANEDAERVRNRKPSGSIGKIGETVIAHSRQIQAGREFHVPEAAPSGRSHRHAPCVTLRDSGAKRYVPKRYG